MTSQTTIKKLPPIKEDVNSMKQRIQDLEREVSQYKSRLDELRKAKNNLIIKKTTEYVKSGIPVLGVNREKNETPKQEFEFQDQSQTNLQYQEEMQRIIDNLENELNESKNLIAALKLENQDLKDVIEKNKKRFDAELSEVLSKNEEYKREVKQWEVMYKEWMQMMEDRVTNINRTHQILQQCIRPSEETNETQN